MAKNQAYREHSGFIFIYPVEFLFWFVKSIKFVFSRVLITKAILIYGDELVGKDY